LCAVLLAGACSAPDAPRAAARAAAEPAFAPAAEPTVEAEGDRLGVPASPFRPLAHDASSYKVGGPYRIAERWYRPKAHKRFSETGTASWYGHKFHGRQTANGEVFNMYAMTAAHRTLPLPSVVRVTNLANGRSVVVRVNDRGPYADNRIIDLSLTAAEKIGFRRKGLAEVRVEMLPELSRRVAEIAKSGGGARKQDRLVAEYRGGGAGPRIYYVQAGAFRDRKNAETMARRLRRHFASVSVHSGKTGNGRTLHRVRVGPEESRQSAQALRARVQARGPRDAFVVRSKG